jgi:hypothetical protein
MSLKYPDILEHNNPNNPLMDDGQLKGSLRIVADKTARNAIPLAKRKVGALVNWTEGIQIISEKYIGPDTTDPEWTNDANWGDMNHPYFSLDITQTLTANSTTTFAIGNKLIFGSIIIKYQITRDNATAMGTIEIVQNVSGLESPVTFTIREINSIGLVGITSAFNGDDIEVSIELDSSSVSNATMIYNLECKFATFSPHSNSWVQQTSPAYILNGLSFVDANNGWAVGNDDITTNIVILNTIDGGANWTQQTSPVISGSLYGVNFFDVNTGWAVGYDGLNIVILNTIDGGANWTQQTSPVISGSLYGVNFIDANNGWGVGDDGGGNIVIVNTIDGGANWTQQTSPVVVGYLARVSFINVNLGWAVGYDESNSIILKYS